MNKMENTGSQLELTSLMTEYENQFDRSNKLDNKVYITITFCGFLFVFIIGLFNGISQLVKPEDGLQLFVSALYILSCIAVMGAYAYVLVFFMRLLQPEQIARMDPEIMQREHLEEMEEEAARLRLIALYREILHLFGGEIQSLHLTDIVGFILCHQINGVFCIIIQLFQRNALFLSHLIFGNGNGTVSEMLVKSTLMILQFLKSRCRIQTQGGIAVTVIEVKRSRIIHCKFHIRSIGLNLLRRHGCSKPRCGVVNNDAVGADHSALVARLIHRIGIHDIAAVRIQRKSAVFSLLEVPLQFQQLVIGQHLIIGGVLYPVCVVIIGLYAGERIRGRSIYSGVLPGGRAQRDSSGP